MVKVVKDVIDKLVIVKFIFNIDDIIKFGLVVENVGVDVVFVINILKVIVIDIYVRKFILSNKVGGYFGFGVKFVVLRVVYDFVRMFDIFVIGIGGIMIW